MERVSVEWCVINGERGVDDCGAVGERMRGEYLCDRNREVLASTGS